MQKKLLASGDRWGQGLLFLASSGHQAVLRSCSVLSILWTLVDNGPLSIVSFCVLGLSSRPRKNSVMCELQCGLEGSVAPSVMLSEIRLLLCCVTYWFTLLEACEVSLALCRCPVIDRYLHSLLSPLSICLAFILVVGPVALRVCQPPSPESF